MYYFVLRSVLRAKSHLRRCLTRCRHCGIFFITDPRNVKRRDLGCPFGCREAHRKRCSTERSVEYYRTREGKFKKSLQNGKRTQAEPAAQSDERPEQEEKPSEKEMGKLDGSGFDAHMVSYLCMVTTLIEGRRVRCDEIVEMLARILRQHSMARRKRRDYIVWYLNKRAP